GLLLSSLLFLVLSGTALAADQNSQHTRNNEATGGALSSGNTYRASELIGTTVKNTKGDDLGKISELVIDSSGKIRYAVLSHGGVLNMGAKMTAVSWKLFQVSSPMSSDENRYSVTLDISKDQLADLPTFNDDSWPNRPQLTDLSSLNTQRMK